MEQCFNNPTCNPQKVINLIGAICKLVNPHQLCFKATAQLSNNDGPSQPSGAGSWKRQTVYLGS